MKMLWFHLMPYTELPEDFRDKHPSVWVDIHSSLFDPRRAHLMYNDFMDEMEYAADCGFDAVCVNEHHSNGYGLMPSPNLIATALARRTRDTAICVMGNSLALYNPPTRVAEEFAMIDCISGGRLIAGFPVGTPMDTCYAYGQNPSLLRERYLEAHDLVMRAWTGAGHLRLQRPLQPAALRQYLAAPGAAAASADLGAGRRIGRDVAVVRRDGLRLLLSFVLRLQGRARHDARLLGRNGAPGQGPQSVPRRLPAIRRRRRKPPARDGPVRRGGRVFLRPLPARRSALRLAPRLCHAKPRQRAGLQSQVQQAANGTTTLGSTTGTRMSNVARDMEAIVDNGYVIIGSPDEVVEQLREVATELNVGQLMLLLQFGNMGKELCQLQHQAVRRTGDAEAAAAVRRVGKPLVAEADARRRARRRAGLPARPRRRIGATE